MSRSSPRLGVIRALDEVEPRWTGCVLTIGNFDGVHLGHRRILERCRQRARQGGGAVVAMTFDPHPVSILAPSKTPAALTMPDERAALLLDAGADGVVIVPVDQSVLSIEAGEFVRRMLVGVLRPVWIIEGPDFGFGRGRRGNVETLRMLSAEGRYQVEVVDPLCVRPAGMEQAMVVSSTAIRGLLDAGRVEAARECLGRAYSLVGRVCRGAGTGKGIGFPTVNLTGIAHQIPGDGVYAGRATIRGERWRAAISIGCRATFDGQVRVVEAFVLDARGDWYGAEARLEFERRLRDQRRFESGAALARQIQSDVAEVRRLIPADETS